MQIILESPKVVYRAGEVIRVRILLLNDSTDVIDIDRRLLIGPNPVPERLTGMPMPVSVEPSLSDEQNHFITLNPWCFYGRERSFDHLPVGALAVHGYVLEEHTHACTPKGPADASLLLGAAEPLTLTIERA